MTGIRGRLEKSRKKRVYVIQEHDASQRHWDLRLELNGVLKSWAIPKAPPEVIGVRRLAVEVEDHPLNYAGFEGRIPEGEYGAGLVQIWDQGTYDPLDVTENKLVVTLHGTRLNGKYCLVRTKIGGKTENWLFFKMKA